MSGKILVLGCQGQVGSRLMEALGDRALGLERSDVDLSNMENVEKTVNTHKPSAIFNAAAYTQVDLAEKETQTADLLNHQLPAKLGQICAAHSIPLVHYSTDYVYSGDGEEPWRESSPVSPINAYGRTKLDGDLAIMDSGANHLIFRTSWVYDSKGKNFLLTILRLASERKELSIVADQIGSPTWAKTIADVSIDCLQKANAMEDFPYGVYHLCNREWTSWHGFAEKIIELYPEKDKLQVETIKGIPSSDFPTPAKRPQNSRLSLEKIDQTFSPKIPSWSSALDSCIRELS